MHSLLRAEIYDKFQEKWRGGFVGSFFDLNMPTPDVTIPEWSEMGKEARNYFFAFPNHDEFFRWFKPDTRDVLWVKDNYPRIRLVEVVVRTCIVSPHGEQAIFHQDDVIERNIILEMNSMQFIREWN